MSELVQIQFHGDVLWAVRKDGKVYVALRPICEALGLAWGSQYNRIKRDAVLSEGVFMMKTPSAGGEQDTMCLPLEYVNGWLFGIEENRIPDPAIRAKVLDYKRECYDVLFRHFFGVAEEAVAARMSGAESAFRPLDDVLNLSEMSVWLALVRECRLTLGRREAQRMWLRSPLPQVESGVSGERGALTPEQEWWRRRLAEGNLIPGRTGWPSEVVAADLYDAFHADMGNGRPREATIPVFAKALVAMVPGLRRSRGGGARSRCWKLLFPALEDCRAAFVRMTGVSL